MKAALLGIGYLFFPLLFHLFKPSLGKFPNSLISSCFFISLPFFLIIRTYYQKLMA